MLQPHIPFWPRVLIEGIRLPWVQVARQSTRRSMTPSKNVILAIGVEYKFVVLS